VAATQKTREKFIELRAENISFNKIAKQLKVSKSTLIMWARLYEMEKRDLFQTFKELNSINNDKKVDIVSIRDILLDGNED